MHVDMKNHKSSEDFIAELNISGKRDVWYQNHPKINYIFKKTKKYFDPQSSICEIGLGDGYLLRLIAKLGNPTSGIDISHYLIDKLNKSFAQNDVPIKLYQADISKPFEIKEKFDVVYCLDILEHIEGDRIFKAIENIKHIVNEDAILIVSLPWRENLKNQMVICPKCNFEFHRIGHHHSFNNINEIYKLFGKDFDIIKFGFVPPSDIPNKLYYLLKKTLLRKYFFLGKYPKFYSSIYLITRAKK